MAFERKADLQFVGDELEIGRVLQGHKILEELANGRRPIRPVISTGESGAKEGTVFEPEGSELVRMSAADLELLGGFEGVHLALVEPAENLQQKRSR